MNSIDFHYDIDDEVKITKQIIYANATFNIEQLFSNHTKDSDLLSVTIITPSQRVSVPFRRSNVNGGHAGMTDIILSRIYPDYIHAKSSDDQKIYSKNNENNIFIMTLDFVISIFTPDGYKINQTQYDELIQFMSEIKSSKYSKSCLTTFFLENNLDVCSFDMDELDEKLKALKDNIVETVIPNQHSIGQLDFSTCENKSEIMKQAEKYANEIRSQEKVSTQTNNFQQIKKDFFRTRKLNTKLENEAREQVNIDMQEILEGRTK